MFLAYSLQIQYSFPLQFPRLRSLQTSPSTTTPADQADRCCRCFAHYLAMSLFQRFMRSSFMSTITTLQGWVFLGFGRDSLDEAFFFNIQKVHQEYQNALIKSDEWFWGSHHFPKLWRNVSADFCSTCRTADLPKGWNCHPILPSTVKHTVCNNSWIVIKIQ